MLKKYMKVEMKFGSHSDTHPHVNNLNYEKNMKELENSNAKIKKITGKRISLYRAPYGEYNDIVIKASNDFNCKTIQWSIDTLDYTGKKGEEMWKRIEDKISMGDIILMHNGTKYTAESLDMIIKNIKRLDYDIVKVSDLIYKDDYYIDNSGVQIKNN